MAETLKVLGQVVPDATTLTTLYTVPGATSVASSTIVVCNRGGTAATFRISVAVAGAGDDNKQYIFYDNALDANVSFAATIGTSLAATDVVRVYASNANLTFQLFGVEVS